MSGNETATPREQVLFLARAESRLRIMEALIESESATQRELRTRLDTSRTTVSRALRSLTEKGWVDKSDGTYHLTRAGQIIAAEFNRTLDTVHGVEELAEFLRWFPADVEMPDFIDASDVEVTYSTDAAPYAPARKQSEILHTADRLQVLLPAIDLESTKTLTEQVVQNGLEVETVASPGVAATIESDEFAPLIREMVRTGRSRTLVAEDSVPFYLGLPGDGPIQVGLADDDGLPRALLETADESVRKWAECIYQDYREEARRISAEEF